MSSVPVDLLSELRHARAEGNSRRMADTLTRWQLSPLTGGRNNLVYAWIDPDRGPICVKVYCRIDDRRQADREWAALTLLAEHGVGNVPRPLWIDRNGREPVIGMTLLNGVPFLDDSDLPEALAGMAVTTRQLQAVPLTGLLAGLERIDSIGHYIHRLTDLWPRQLAERAEDPLSEEMCRLLADWQASGDRAVLAESGPAVLSRGDANLLNWLRVPGASACVDFEFSGRSTVVFDAADHVEHISARQVPDALWCDMLVDFGVAPVDHRVFGAAQRVCALRWLASLWNQRHRRAAEFEAQYRRVESLRREGSPWGR